MLINPKVEPKFILNFVFPSLSWASLFISFFKNSFTSWETEEEKENEVTSNSSDQ